MKKSLLLLILISLFFGQCRQKEFILSIDGNLSDNVFGGNLPGVNLILEMQVLQNGVFNSTYQTVASTTSDGSGNYEFSFDRENVIEYRISTVKEGYLNDVFQIDPENLSPGEVYTFNIGLIPKATFDVHLVNTFPENEFDSITFRNLAVSFDCVCCNSEERIFGGMDVDTTLSCNLHGESWIKYFVEIERDTAFSSYIDSLYCPAFEVTTLELLY